VTRATWVATHPVRGSKEVAENAVVRAVRSNPKRAASQKSTGAQSSKMTRNQAAKRRRIAADVARLTPEQRKAYLARQPKRKPKVQVETVAEAYARVQAQMPTNHIDDSPRPTGFGIDSYDYF
jgi:hypothetical protein